jgi:hypothetical protein
MKFFKQIENFLVYTAIIVGFGGLIGVIVYLHWCSYFQRFPNASWWTFFFQH